MAAEPRCRYCAKNVTVREVQMLQVNETGHTGRQGARKRLDCDTKSFRSMMSGNLICSCHADIQFKLCLKNRDLRMSWDTHRCSLAGQKVLQRIGIVRVHGRLMIVSVVRVLQTPSSSNSVPVSSIVAMLYMPMTPKAGVHGIAWTVFSDT